ncbi:MAG: insulinase family protein, partial [Muribaculaceae bacterium]|nr:insulinase family protein [Muribaculaceae bacterium]
MQPLDNTHLHTLDNGLKIIHVQNQSLVAWCGLAVNAGSRDDPDGRFGLAHFVEHTIFKGTTHRKAWHILNRMENVGGELNAYTTKENTMLYSVFPHGHEQRALELIADLVNWSVFPKAELDKEREVVIEEVMSYRDTPAEAIFDDFEDMVFAGSQLGHNILGVEKDLDNITSQECSAYLKTLYVPGNMVLFSVGPEKPERILRLAEKHFATMNHPLSATAKRTAPPVMPPAHNATHFDLHQSH